ncbi:FAD-dependent monooxygenase [Amycolatopsis sp. H20-H5]|uniref:FAD-dependent monooxygenase n=1 Tax=Amycolatopsis sp. H20-H5 TaxID=3046309 RepID=UPI002DB979E6|nr:FAD-dependent monooxygenase [Amycolatopsis sp. H20-H5]MEC3976903.1 FAD-dependent monooxygenase [Amycolatopsis sp. H20-H5]
MGTGGAPRVAIAGGGPAGLFLARMIGLKLPRATVEVYERNGPGDVSGFGVTLSDRTLSGLARHDPETHRLIIDASVTLSGIEVRPPGARLRYDGFGAAAISRHTLLKILREQATEAGARIHYRARAEDLDADVVAFADGARSSHRDARREAFGTETRTGAARYVWLGTSADFGDAATLAFERTEHGPVAAHCYSYGRSPGRSSGSAMSTVVVELDETTWRAAGLDDGAEIDGDAPPWLSEVFAEHLDGHKLVGNHSRWGRFTVVRNASWSDGNTVLLGDAAHTAHFTVSSGTKMALEDAIALGRALSEHDGHPAAAFAEYERLRRGPVARTQHWAEPSMHWWETYGRRLHQPPSQFGMHFLTRTRAISYLGLRRRCADRIDEAEADYFRAAGFTGTPPHAIAAPFTVDGVRLTDRLVTAVPQADGEVLIDDAIRFAELSCVDIPENGPAADELLRQALARGLPGVLLRADPLTHWHTTLRLASRVRTETGLAVAVEVPADWALDLTREADTDPWPARIHLALLTGRTDLVVPTR